MQEPHEDGQGSVFSAITDHVKDYAKTRIAYYKLVAAEGAGKAAAGAAVGVLLALFGLFFLLFISITGALAIGHALDNNVYGFLIISGFYLLCAILVLVLKNSLIETPIINGIIKAIANPKESEDNGH
jgi:protein-S-isoprenylcysteine O-methyltransferase Ste14